MANASIPKQRIEWLDIAKGGSIICVAMLHSTMYLHANGFDPHYVGTLNDLLKPVRMPLFFTISGILGASVLQRDWKSLFAKQIWTFAYLFALWSLIRWVYFRHFQTNMVTPAEGSSVLELVTMWVMPESGLWFIWALAIYFLVGRLLFRAPLVAIGGSLVAAAMTWGGLITTANYVHQNVITYMPFFLTGLYFGLPVVKAITTRPLTIGLGGALAYAGLKWGLIPRLGDGLDYGVAAVLLSVAGLSLGCAMAIGVERFRLGNKLFAYIGRNTLPIYVTHVILVSGLSACLAKILPGNALVNYVGAPVVLATAIAMALMIKAVANSVSVWWIYRPPRMA
jgi:uncharacterized membrane protein YcfT